MEINPVFIKKEPLDFFPSIDKEIQDNQTNSTDVQTVYSPSHFLMNNTLKGHNKQPSKFDSTTKSHGTQEFPESKSKGAEPNIKTKQEPFIEKTLPAKSHMETSDEKCWKKNIKIEPFAENVATEDSKLRNKISGLGLLNKFEIISPINIKTESAEETVNHNNNTMLHDSKTRHRETHIKLEDLEDDLTLESASKDDMQSSETLQLEVGNGEMQIELDIADDESGQALDLIFEKNTGPLESPLEQKKKSRPKIHKCNVCAISFQFQSELKKHYSVHSGEKPYSCDVCSKAFRCRTGLYLHLRVHSDKRPYVCDICKKTFKDKGHLTCHIRTHSGETPFSCHLCTKSFGIRSNLQKHLKRHSGDKPHICDVCGKCFVMNCMLQAHMRSHIGRRPHKCNLCEKAFAEASHLRVHSRVHSGEKPFKCELCEKSFIGRNHLYKHIQTHRTDKPYHCDYCSKSFKGRSNVQKHMKIHAKSVYAADRQIRKWQQNNSV